MIWVIIQGLLNGVAAYLAFHITVHPLGGGENKVKILFLRMNILALKLTIVSCCVASIIVSAIQYHRAEKSENRNFETITNLTNKLQKNDDDISNLRVEMKQEFSRILHDFSTNNTITTTVRLAILDDQQEKIATQISEVQKRIAVVSPTIPDIATIRAERENRRQLQELQDRDKEIQRAKDEIKQHEEQAKAQIAQQEEDQRNKAEAVKEEAKQTEIYLNIFDYSIRRLHTMLLVFSKDTVEKITSDFPEGLPSAYNNSEFVSNGHLVMGTNTISIGTNLAWHFEIATVGNSQFDKSDPSQQLRYKYNPNNPKSRPLPFALEIRTKRLPRRFGQILAITPYNDSVSIKFGTLGQLVINDAPSIADCKTNIDAAITAMLDSVDQRVPLPTDSNAPAR